MKVRCFRSILLAGFLAAWVNPTWAAQPSEELLRLVGDDVGFCVVVQDLRSHLAALTGSPFAAQLRTSLLGQAIGNAPELVRLAETEKQLKAITGLDWPQLRDEILGDCIVFAYRPGPPGKPQEEQGIILVRAGNPRLLATLVERLNAAQLNAGDLEKVEEIEYGGVKYFRRVEKKKVPSFYMIQGPVLAVSSQEAMLRRAIDLAKTTGQKEEPPLVRQLRQLGIDKAPLAVWLNPRAFDDELAARVAQAQGGEAAFLKTFLTNWKALDSIAFFTRLDQNLELGLAVRARIQSLSPGVRKFLAEAGKPSELWKAFSEKAILAMAGRIDVPLLLDAADDFLTEDARKSFREGLENGPLGHLAKAVLPNLGPDCGFCISAPPAGDNWAPEVIGALRVRPGLGEVPADQTLLDGVNFLANVAVLNYNGKQPDRLTLKTALQDQVEVKYFVNDKRFPAGFQPAYAVKDGYLLLGSSPEMIRSFRLAGSGPGGEQVPFLRASLAELRTYLKDRREPLADHLAEKHQVARAEAVSRLDSIRLGLQFFDRVDVAARTTPEQLTLTLRIKTNQPLRKE